jgi:hypothetical protein
MGRKVSINRAWLLAMAVPALALSLGLAACGSDDSTEANSGGSSGGGSGGGGTGGGGGGTGGGGSGGIPPLAAAVDLSDDHAVGVVHWPDGAFQGGAFGQVVDGLACEPAMVDTYHVHTHLSIFLNGEALAIPADIGIAEPTPASTCFYSVHTHDHSGKLHIEAAAPGLFKLGMFFDEWGQPLELNNIAGLMNMPVVVYVTDNGVTTKVDSGWPDIELKSHREITIQIGSEISAIPNFIWYSN